MLDFPHDSSKTHYFDTAWPYHGGTAEAAVGEILARYPRSSYYLATKFPGHAAGSFEKIADIFTEQLARTKAGYFDFYLLHNVCEADIDAYCAAAGFRNCLLRLRRSARCYFRRNRRRRLRFGIFRQFPASE